MGATSVFISLEKNGVISCVDLGKRALVPSCAIKLVSKTVSQASASKNKKMFAKKKKTFGLPMPAEASRCIPRAAEHAKTNGFHAFSEGAPFFQLEDGHFVTYILHKLIFGMHFLRGNEGSQKINVNSTVHLAARFHLTRKKCGYFQGGCS